MASPGLTFHFSSVPHQHRAFAELQARGQRLGAEGGKQRRHDAAVLEAA
jgi:hypothetical protein